jgi:hypothetical protein
MLSLYDVDKAPGVDHVQLYRDDERPHVYYMLTSRPTIARDDEGNPLFTFILYARDTDRLAPEDREVERGYLSLSTQAGVTEDEERKIRSYLRDKLQSQRDRYRFLGAMVEETEPVLSYPPLFTKGSVAFETFSADMVPYSAGSKAPSLIGTNVASFSQTLSQDGAELFRQAVEKGKTPAIINYALTFAARIPAVTIRIHGDSNAFYQEVKSYIQRTYVGQWVYGWTYYCYSPSWTELASMQRFRSEFQSLTVEIDDREFRDADPSDNITQKLEELAFRILETSILPAFFEKALKEEAPPQPTEGGGVAPAKPDPRYGTTESFSGTIDVTFRRSDVVAVDINPNAQLSQVLTSEEIAENTAYVDLSDTAFHELDVKLNANVNFVDDPVFALKVFLDYDQMDEVRNTRIKRAKEFLFRDAATVHRFRQIMAKGADGSVKDSYNYFSEIVYKDTGQTVRIPAQGMLPSRERELIISYSRLGFIKVNLTLGSMPESVTAVEVRMRYPGSGEASAQQSFVLDKAHPTASFFTYTGSTETAQPYLYSLSYILGDGQRVDVPEQGSQAETLTIPDPFEHRVTTRFLAQANFEVVEKIIVDARYRDPANDFGTDHHAEMMSNGETSEWSFGLRAPEMLDIEYDVITVFKSGAREEKLGQRARAGGTIAVGLGAVDALEVVVISSEVDWTKYSLVVVSLRYQDAANGVSEDTNLTLRQGDADEKWTVLLRDRDLRTFEYRTRFVGKEGTPNEETDWTATADEVLIVQ